MTQFFQNYFHLALEAMIVILIVLALRPLFKRFSKRVASLLWIVVFFRLLCPVTIEGPVPAFWNGWLSEGETTNGAIEEARNVQDAQAVRDLNASQLEGEGRDLSEAYAGQDGAELIAANAGNPAEDADGEGRAAYDWLEKIRANQEAGEIGQSAGEASESAQILNADGEALDAEEFEATQGEPNEIADAQDVREEQATETKENAQSQTAAVAEASKREPEADHNASKPEAEKAGKRSLADHYAAVQTWLHGITAKSLANVFGVLWIFGAIVFLTYGIWSYVRLYGKLREAIPMGTWKKYPLKISDMAGVPMSFGILHPEIYVPASFQDNAKAPKAMDEKEREMILRHEETHLKRRDPLWKLVSILALAMHWWNPLVWLCIRLFHKDMEMACDEGVLEQIGQERRGDYAKALLHFAEQNSGFSMAAAFGESNAESRIKETLNYQKRPVWLSVTLSCLVLLLAGCLATNPRAEGEDETSEEKTVISTEETLKGKEPSAQVSEEQKLYGAESVTEDGYYIYATGEDLQEGFQDRFRDILLGEGKISENDMFFTYTNTEHHENGVAAKRSGEHLSSWPMGICIDADGLLTQYAARLDYYLEDGKYYLGDAEITDNSKVDTYEQAVLFNTFAGLTDSSLLKQEENVPMLYLDRRSTFFDVMAELWKEKNPEKYEKLMDPVTAVTEVMHLQGGKGEVIASQNYGKVVKYTFADGKSVRYRVKKRGDEWMPSDLLEYSKAIRERYPDDYPNKSERTEEEWLAELQKTEKYLQTATAAQLRKVTRQTAISGEPYWEDGKEGDFTILDAISQKDATLYGLYGDGGMVLRVGDKTYPIWLSWASLYHGPKLYVGDYDGDGVEEYALVVITGTGTGVYKEGLYVIELQGNEAEVHEFTEFKKYEELEKRLTYEYDKKEKRLTLAIDKGNPELASYVSLFLEGHFPEDQEDNWLSSPVELGFGDQERMAPVDDDLFYELEGGLIFGAEDAPAWLQYEVSAKLTCRVQYHADGSFSIGKISGSAEYYDEVISDLSESDALLGEEVILEQHADLTRDGVKDVIVTSVTYHEENQSQTWKERLEQYESCFVRVYNGAYEGNIDKENYANKGGYNVTNAIWKGELANAHVGNGMILLCQKDGKEYLLTGSMSMWQGVVDPEYRVFSLGEDGTEYEIETGRTTASVTAPEDVWNIEEMISYTKKLDAWTKNATLLAFTSIEYDNRIGGKFDASESWKSLYSTVQEFKDAIEYSGDQLGEAIPKVIPLQGMSNLETSLNSLHACWKACAEWIAYSDNMHNILTDLQSGKNIHTCHLTHGRTPETVTVDYKDAVSHTSDKILIDIKNHDGKTIWNTAVSVKNDAWECYYLTIYEEQAYMIRYVPVHEVNGVSEGSFKMFYLNERGEEQVVCECSVSSKDSKDFEKDKAAFEKTKDDHMGKMNLIVGVMNGEIAIKQVR